MALKATGVPPASPTNNHLMDPNNPDYLADDSEELFGPGGELKGAHRAAGVSPRSQKTYYKPRSIRKRKGMIGQGAFDAANALYGRGNDPEELPEGYEIEPETGMQIKIGSKTADKFERLDKADPALAEERKGEKKRIEEKEQIKQEEKIVKTETENLKEEKKTLEKQEKLQTRREKEGKQDRETFTFRQKLIELEGQQKQLYAKGISGESQSRIMFSHNTAALQQITDLAKGQAEPVNQMSKGEQAVYHREFERLTHLLEKFLTAKSSEQRSLSNELAGMRKGFASIAEQPGMEHVGAKLQELATAAEPSAKKWTVNERISGAIGDGVQNFVRAQFDNGGWLKRTAMSVLGGGQGGFLTNAGRGKVFEQQRAENLQKASALESVKLGLQVNRRGERIGDREPTRRISRTAWFLGAPEEATPDNGQMKIQDLVIGSLNVDVLTVKKLEMPDKDEESWKARTLDPDKVKDGWLGTRKSEEPEKKKSNIGEWIAGLLLAAKSLFGNMLKGLGELFSLSSMSVLGKALGSAIAIAAAGFIGYQIGKALNPYLDKFMEKLTGRKGESVGTGAYELIDRGQRKSVAWNAASIATGGKVGADETKADIAAMRNSQASRQWREDHPFLTSAFEKMGIDMGATKAETPIMQSSITSGQKMDRLVAPESLQRSMNAPVVMAPSAAISQRTAMVDDATRQAESMKDARGAAPIIVNNVTQGGGKQATGANLPNTMGAPRSQDSSFARYLLTVFAAM